MTGYTKLFQSILDSTIWQEPNHIRLIWITMLAMANKNSVVESSVPGLAKRAMVTIDECLEALERLKQPDSFSRTKDHEGRRIEEIDGGWFLFNHGKYRDLVTLQEKRAQDAERARRYRERKKKSDERDGSREITPPSPSSTPSSTPKKEDPPIPPKGIVYVAPFETFWKLYPNKKSGKLSAYKAWKRATKIAHVSDLENAVKKQKTWHDWIKNGGQYIPMATTWLNQGRWTAEYTPPDPSQSNPGRPEYDGLTAQARQTKRQDEALRRAFEGD